MSDPRDRPQYRQRRRRHRPPPKSKFQQTFLKMPGAKDYLGWGAIAAASLVLLWYFLYLASGDGGRLLGYANAGGFWFGLIALIAGLLLSVKRIATFAAIGILFGLILLWQGTGLALFGSGGDAPHFRVVSASLRSLNTDMASAAKVLLAPQPDVIVAQEAHVADLLNQLDRSGQQWNHAEHEMQVIACRCRIVASRTQDGILSADLALPGGTVRLWNVRAPKAYNDQAVNQSYFTSLASQIGGQANAVAAGDYNATPWNDGYSITASVARDAWRQAGVGPGFTFPTRARRLGMLMPLIQIDHVFLGDSLRATRMKVLHASPGADHYPIVTDIARRA